MGTFLKQAGAIISIPPLDSEVEDIDDAVAATELRRLQIPAAHHGDRIDRALAALVAELSRSYLQQLLESGLVAVNGRAVGKASQRVKASDSVVIEMRPTQQSQAFTPQAMQLQVVYKDDHILVIDKPAGLVVHPAPGNWSGTLLNGLLAMDHKSALLPRAGIVHRLDKDTSGLMVVARTRLAMDKLVAAIAARVVSRQYLALGHNHWVGMDRQSVDAPVGRDPRNRLRMAVVDPERSHGKPARTDFVLLGNTDQGCFVRCILHTGRTHQIRVHMASLGHPLIADEVYGGVRVGSLQRQALHAFHLSFEHPVSGRTLVFESPLPADIDALLSEWGLRYNPPNGLMSP